MAMLSLHSCGGGTFLVNADIQEIEAFFVEEKDSHVHPIGIKGVGEIGNAGSGAAVIAKCRNVTCNGATCVRGFPPLSNVAFSTGIVVLIADAYIKSISFN
ncbi:hypothetical protein [Iningainema tapete]|uniref:Uncharacterized protein n=1 Tax=Iningainema tapete BLCC-T55 TaxID=2748662 RepID=A0A8J7C4X3_9CYAN|nr:hypothetical protein [Iningainema tapete]MBD2772229.1 hypothetical protein [Iningainema tapete BLCC-T55]